MESSLLIKSAGAAHASGRFEESSRICRQILESDPENPQALLLLGVVEAKVGDPGKAIKLLQQVETADPTSFQASLWLSVACRKLGQSAVAVQAASRAVDKKPGDPQALTQLGLSFLEARMLPESERCFRDAIRSDRTAPQILFALVRSLYLQGKFSEADETTQEAICLAKQSVSDLLRLGQILLNEENISAAEACFRHALELDPNSSKTNLLLAQALMRSNQASEAERCLRVSLVMKPSDSDAETLRGNALQELGQIAEASQAFDRAIELDSKKARAYFALVHNRRIVESDRPLMARMAALVSDTEMPPKEISYLHYALGKANENLSEYREALAHYDSANEIERKLKFRGRPFDREAYEEALERTARQFSESSLRVCAGCDSPSELPIFVVGMMRSGTTLVEQILSSHPDVGAAGEQSFWLDNWREGFAENGCEGDPARLRVVADRYCSVLAKIAPGTSRVVDKMPANYAGLGVIHKALPRARFVHIRRNPADTCISIWATPNRARVAFAHDRDNIVFAYRQYLKIMEHWRSVLPHECLFEIDYEELVSNTEAATRKVISFCGLGWSDECLKPEENVRAVITPSVWQVRQPVYKNSVERWRKFEPWLGVFEQLLSVKHPSRRESSDARV